MPIALYLGLISFLSHQPSLTIPGDLPDWIAHGTEYAVLGWLVSRVVVRLGPSPAVWGLALAGCAVFGLLDEYHQSFVPGRDASLHDAAADTGGAALALGVAALVDSRRRSGGAGMAQMVEIVVYGRRDCHLCEEAERAVRDAVGPDDRGVTIRKVDVDQDEELRRLYGEQVPVVLVNGRRMFKLRVDPEKLRRRIAWLREERNG